MKKISLIALFAALVMSVNAAEIWQGSQHISWKDGGLQLGKEAFAEAQPGQKLVITYASASDGIEFKADGKNIVGSRREAWISGDGTYELWLTEYAVDAIQTYGLEIVGANFDAKKVELLDGKILKEGKTIWTGFFWAGEWQTLYLHTEGFNVIDFSKVEAIRFYSEAAGDDFDFNFRNDWKPEGYIADRNNVNISFGEGYMNLNLDDEMRTKLTNAGELICQYNTKDKSTAAFNVTDIVLVPKDGGSTAVENTTVSEKAVKTVVDGQIVIIKNGVRYNTLGAQLR